MTNTILPFSIAPTPKQSEVQVIFQALECLDSRKLALIHSLRQFLFMLAEAMSEKGQESVFMVRNRFGLTKEQAKKLYYDYHGAGEEQTPIEINRKETSNSRGKNFHDYGLYEGNLCQAGPDRERYCF